jgi:hypothetical protein
VAEFLEEDLTCMRERCEELAERLDELANQCQGYMIVTELARLLLERRRAGKPTAEVELRLERAIKLVDGETEQLAAPATG